MSQQSQQQFLMHIPWDDFMHYIPAIGAALTVISTILDGNYMIIINLITSGLWVYYLESSKKEILRYYKQQMQQIVSKTIESQPTIQQDIKQFNIIQRNTKTYIHLFMIMLLIQILSLYFSYAQVLTYKNPLDMACYSLLSLFIYLSNKHFENRYQSGYNRHLFLQIRVVQGALIVLAIVMVRYAISKMDDTIDQFITFTLLLSSSAFSGFTFNRFGKTSQRSFITFLIGAMFLFLSDALNIILKVQRKEMIELIASANVLYQVGFYMLYQSLYLHVKAYNDHFILLLRIKFNL